MLSSVSGISTSTVSTLQSIRSLNSDITTTQKQISSGKRVATAKDDGGVWALSKSMEAAIAVNKNYIAGMSTAVGAVSAVSAAIETAVDMINDLKSSILSYQDLDSNATTLSATSVAGLEDAMAQITTVLTNASFEGIDLIGTGGADETITVGTDSSGTAVTLTLEATNVTGGTTAYASLATTWGALATTTTYASLSSALTNVVAELKGAAGFYGNTSKQLDNMIDFREAVNDNLSNALSALVDTDMDEASARLTALQTQQQLATQVLGITAQNQSTMIQTLYRYI
ncbi:flagellin [Roseomonas sp. GC11]|uniref:flagellin n=1 Tax=Roseomonas sp. GC11 TaxID=2950546 RepID=UPI0021096601|nr:flagellin [Roseomonas sp. GC11]MCQ4159986.1 flagellin [Roseomonas sp. GC11]